MKENLEFYQHFTDADRHPKFKMLRVKYGWEGEGKFWALNNRIATAKNGWLNLSKKFIKAAIASDLDFNIDQFDEYISYLNSECELIILDENSESISTETVQENLEKVMKERGAARDRKNRKKTVQSDSSPEQEKSSPELSDSSPERNNKPNQTKPNKTKLNKNLPVYPHCTDIFKGISESIPKVDGLFKKNNQKFNARKWAVEQYRNRGHPKAILKTFESLLSAQFVIERPYGIANHIMERENGNYHEKDHIEIHEELKKMNPEQLSELTYGLIEGIA